MEYHQLSFSGWLDQEPYSWRSQEYLQLVYYIANPGLELDPGLSQEIEKIVEIFKIDREQINEQFRQICLDTFENPYDNERYQVPTGVNYHQTPIGYKIPWDIDPRDPITLNQQWLLARTLGEIILEVVFGKGHSSFEYLTSKSGGLIVQETAIAKRFIYFLLESTLASEILGDSSEKIHILGLIYAINSLCKFKEIVPYVIDWYKTTMPDGKFIRYFPSDDNNPYGYVVTIPPEEIIQVVDLINEFTEPTFFTETKALEKRRKQVEMRLQAKFRNIDDIVEILNPAFTPYDTPEKIENELQEVREDVSKQAGIPEYYLRVHQQHYKAPLPGEDYWDEISKETKVLMNYLHVLKDASKTVHLGDIRPDYQRITPDELALCLDALHIAISYSKQPEFEYLKKNLVLWLVYFMENSYIEPDNKMHVMKIIALRNPDLLTYLVPQILNKVTGNSETVGFTISQAKLVNGQIIYGREEEQEPIVKLYKTKGGFIYKPGRKDKDIGVLARSFLSIAQMYAIPIEILELFIQYLKAFKVYFSSEKEFSDETWVIDKVDSYIAELEKCKQT